MRLSRHTGGSKGGNDTTNEVCGVKAWRGWVRSLLRGFEKWGVHLARTPLSSLREGRI